MFEHLRNINKRPEPWSVYTARDLWTDPHTAKAMLKFHLDPECPLASRAHDTIDRSVAWMRSRFDIRPGTSIADFGCGPGLYAARLARLGARVTGIDFSANSIRHARETAAREGLAIDYLEGDYLDFESGRRFDLISMIFCDFCALSPVQRSRLLGIFHRHLKDDGALFLDVHALPGYEQRQEQAVYEFRQLNGFWSAEDYYGFVNTFKYDAEKVVLDKYSLFEANRSWTIYNWLQYFSLEKLTEEFARTGFIVREVYADVTGAPHRAGAPDMAVVAGKRR